jgi:hypothetical protein
MRQLKTMINRIYLGGLMIGLLTTIARAQPPAPHGMFLRQPVPADGSVAAFNAPVLRWPYQKGKSIRYEVELSRDSTFQDTSTIRVRDLPGAIWHPHRAISPGRWFWRHRVSGKTWSAPLRFQVTSSSIPNASPASLKFLKGVSTTHPRILRLPDAGRGKLRLTDPLAVAIFSEADSIIRVGIIPRDSAAPLRQAKDPAQLKKLRQDAVVYLGERFLTGITLVSQADRLRTDERYRNFAVGQALVIAGWDADGVTESSDFADGACMYAMALAFDSFHDRMSPAERDSLVRAIGHRAARFHAAWVNNIESKVLSGHVWQYILNEFFHTSLALVGHHPEAGTWLSYAYELFTARMPVLGGIDGGWSEGAHYFTMNMDMLVDIPEQIRRITGFDLIRQHPWYREQGWWMTYHIPPGSMSDGYGDNAEEYIARPAYAAFAEYISRRNGAPIYDWYLQKFRKLQGDDLAKEHILRWQRLIEGTNVSAPKKPEMPVLPLMQISRDVGLAAMHSDHKVPAKDVMVAFRSGPIGAYGHILADQNTFNILAGGHRLFYRTGYKVAMDDPHRVGWSKHTRSQNGILIDDKGQPYNAESYGYLNAHLQGQRLAYVAGDASGAYRSEESKEDHGMRRFIRHLVFLRPGLVVVYDELEARQAAQWSWLIHSIEPMQLDAAKGMFNARVPGFSGQGRLFSEHPVRWTLTDKFDVPAVGFRDLRGKMRTEYSDDQWHAKAVSVSPVQRTRFLSVIRVTPDSVIREIRGEVDEKGMLRVKADGWEITASLTHDVAASLDIRSDDGMFVFSSTGAAFIHRGKTYEAGASGVPRLLEMLDGKAQVSNGQRWGIPEIK